MERCSTFLAGVTLFSLHATPQVIFITVSAVRLAVALCHAFSYYRFPISLVLTLCSAYGLFSGLGFLLVGLGIFGYFTVGWQGVGTFIAARLITGAALGLVFAFWSRRTLKTIGVLPDGSEGNFLNAHRILAIRNDISSDLSVDDAQVQPYFFSPSFIQLRSVWPEVARRIVHLK